MLDLDYRNRVKDKFRPIGTYAAILITGMSSLFGSAQDSFGTEDLFSYQMVDADSDNKETVIAEILTVQESLLIPLEATELPTFAQTGFITIQRSPQYLLKFLEKGKILVTHHQNQVIGYLLLEEIDGYIHWAQGRRMDVELSLASLDGVKYIDQVAVLTPFVQQGIETALIRHAKELSPNGILTDILAKPHPNLASMALFRNNGFIHLGSVYVEATDPLPAHQVALMLWLP